MSLKSLFLTEEEPVSPPPSEKVEVKTVVEEKPVLSPINSKTKKILIDVLEEEGAKKIGYRQYKKSLEDLKPIIYDEKTRFAAAFIAASSLGLTRDNLFSTLEDSKKILEKEKIRFDSNVNTDLDEELKFNRGKISTLEEDITKKSEELQKITQEIAELQKQKKDSEEYILSKQNKVEKLKEDFNSSYNELFRELESDLNKIKTYLQ